MTMKLLLVLVCVVVGVKGQVTGTDPPDGSCLRVDVTSSLNVRNSGCGTVIGQANDDDCYVYSGAKTTCVMSGVTYEYFEVTFGAGMGWIAGNYLDLANGPCICMNTDNVNIRNAGCGSTVLGQGDDGDCYEYSGDKVDCTLNGVPHEYFEVTYGSGMGWIASDYLDIPDGSCLCLNTDNVNVRDAACGNVKGKGYNSACYEYSGAKTTCSLNGVTYEYLEVKYGGGVGWIARDFLDLKDVSVCQVCPGGPPPSFTDNCLACICQTEGCLPYEGQCYWDVTSDSCGPFAIKLAYWCDANNISPSACSTYDQQWRDCAKKYDCSVETVYGYMCRYGEYCTEGVTPTCEDFARIHNGGPLGCRSSSTDGYWGYINTCCDGKTGGCD